VPESEEGAAMDEPEGSDHDAGSPSTARTRISRENAGLGCANVKTHASGNGRDG